MTNAQQAFAQLCRPKANETEMGAALIANNSEGRNFDFDVDLVHYIYSRFHVQKVIFCSALHRDLVTP